MLSLLLTLFISMFSICPAFNKVDHIENDNYYLPKQSVTYTDFGHTGYVTNYFEMSNDNAFENHLLSMLNIWSGYDQASGSVINVYTQLNMSGLYVQIPSYYPLQNSYDDMYTFVTTNYSGFEVIRVTLFNAIFSSWSSDPSVNTKKYDLYQGDLYLRNGNILSYQIYNSGDGTFSCSYNYKDVNAVPIEINPMDKCFFATDSCTLGNAFLSQTGNSLVQNADEYYRDGYNAGYQTGVNTGTTAGYNTGYGEGYNVGQQDGYNEGLAHADYDSTALTIMQGIIDVGLLPVNVFLMILNFEVFGVNVSGFVSALLTISIVIIIVRFLFGGKSDDK